MNNSKYLKNAKNKGNIIYQYPNDEFSFSSGEIEYLSEKKFSHSACTDHGSSGSQKLW